MKKRFHLPDAQKALVGIVGHANHFGVYPLFRIDSIALQVILQPIAESFRVLAAVKKFSHYTEGIAPRAVVLGVESRSNPAPRTIAQERLVVMLKLLVAEQPVLVNPF